MKDWPFTLASGLSEFLISNLFDFDNKQNESFGWFMVFHITCDAPGFLCRFIKVNAIELLNILIVHNFFRATYLLKMILFCFR